MTVVERAKLLLERARATTGYSRWSSHNPPPSVAEMAEVMELLVAELEPSSAPKPYTADAS